jgi:hypothetical protein
MIHVTWVTTTLGELHAVREPDAAEELVKALRTLGFEPVATPVDS